ncbi:MAG: TRAP transporter small permease [Candidatus Puniceispirillales bacterium WSBS_2018_MAG_OTU23]
MNNPIDKLMQRLAGFSAIIGGIVLSSLILLTCLSILGRSLNTFLYGGIAQSYFKPAADFFIKLGVAPINGDFELVEAGIAFAVFAFLPICQLTDGHAKVDIIFNRFPRWLSRGLTVATNMVFAAVMVLIAWRLYEGMMAKMRYGETSFLIQFPVWWGYGFSLIAAILAAVTACYVAYKTTMMGRLDD